MLTKKIRDEWDSKLRSVGFSDHEDSRGNLSQPDLRTNLFEMRDQVRDFFLSLDHLLTHYVEMPAFERKVLESYSAGLKIKKISQKLKCSYKTCKMVIKRYRGLVKALNSMSDDTP